MTFPRLAFNTFAKDLPLNGIELLGYRRSPWPRRKRRTDRQHCTCGAFLRKPNLGDFWRGCRRCGALHLVRRPSHG